MTIDAVIQNVTNLVVATGVDSTMYTPPSGYYLEPMIGSDSQPAQTGYVYTSGAGGSLGTYSVPPPTTYQLQSECIIQVNGLITTLSCGSYTINPQDEDKFNWGEILRKMEDENTTDNRVIVDVTGNSQTVTNSQLFTTYVAYADLLQLCANVTQSVYADIASLTTTTYAQVDSSVATYAAAVTARTKLTSMRSLMSTLSSSLSSLAATVPPAQVNSDWSATSGVANILNKPSIMTVFNGTTAISNPKLFTASATVSGGVATFYLTANGTSSGTALFPNGPITPSLNYFVNDATASYQMSAVWSNSNKTLTVTTNKLGTANILTGILGQVAANGAVVNITVLGS